MKAKYFSFLLPISVCFGMQKEVETSTLPHIKLKGHDGAVLVATFSPDNQLIASGSSSDKNNLMVWQNKTGQLLHNLVGHTAEITALKFTDYVPLLVSGSNGKDNNLKIWDTQTGKKIYDLVYHTNDITAIDYTINTGFIVTASNGSEKNLALWNSITGELMHALVGHTGGIDMVQFDPTGEIIASSNPSWSGGPKQTIFLWNTQGQQLKKICFDDVNGDLAFNKNLTQYAGSRLYPNDNPKNGPVMNAILTVWDMNFEEIKQQTYPKQVFVGHMSEVAFACFSPDSTKIVSGSIDNKNNLILWNTITGNIIVNLTRQDERVILTAQFSPNERYIVTGGITNNNGYLSIWDLTTKNIIYDIKNDARITSAQWSPNGKYLITAGSQRSNSNIGELILWLFDQVSQQ